MMARERVGGVKVMRGRGRGVRGDASRVKSFLARSHVHPLTKRWVTSEEAVVIPAGRASSARGALHLVFLRVYLLITTIYEAVQVRIKKIPLPS